MYFFLLLLSVYGFVGIKLWGSALTSFGVLRLLGVIGIGLVAILFLNYIQDFVFNNQKIFLPIVMGAIIAVTVISLPVYSYTLIILGALFNIIVILANDGKMPVLISKFDSWENKSKDSSIHTDDIGAKLMFLGDRFYIPGLPFDLPFESSLSFDEGLASIGDILVLIGLWVGFIYHLIVIL